MPWTSVAQPRRAPKSFMGGTAAIVFAGFVALMTASSPVRAATDAAGFVTHLATKVLQAVDDPQLSAAAREKQIHAIATEGFDVPAIARFVLGIYWRTTSPEERAEFTKAFEDYMVKVYASRFTQYGGNGVKFRVTKVMPQNDSKTLVRSEILQSGGKPPIKVDWWIDKKNGTYKIFDVSIEGISQLLTYRDEFTSIIDRNGGHVSGLIQQLRNKVQG